MYSQEKPTLRTLLGEYPKTAAIRQGTLKSDLFDIDLAPISLAQNGFKPMMRALAYDVAEVAIMTFLLGHDHGKPYSLLPFVMNGRFHHGSIWYNISKGHLTPKDLEGRRVGLRAYSQTTPTWVRGILADEFGVNLDKIKWVTFEDSHVAEFQEPGSVTRAPTGKKLIDMLLEGELDAALVGSPAPDARIKQMIADPGAAARAFWARSHAVPINHMVAVRTELVEERPDIVHDLFRLLVESRQIAGGTVIMDGIDLQPVGLENVRGAIDMAADLAYRQGLIRSKPSIDDLFGDVTGQLTARTARQTVDGGAMNEGREHK